MYFYIFREAQLMAYMLSYGFNCSVIIKRHDIKRYEDRWDERWKVFTNSAMDNWCEIEEKIFQQFEKNKLAFNKNKPIWWNDNILKEIDRFKAATRVKIELENARKTIDIASFIFIFL